MSARILVAEDEPDIRQLIAVSLRMAGHTIEQAEDGESAMAQIQANPPDLLIVDVMMPGLSGHDVARRLAGDPRTAAIPILMLSAKGQTRDVDEGLASGAHAYVVKPFSPRELVARVAEMLDGAELGARSWELGAGSLLALSSGMTFLEARDLRLTSSP